MVHSAVPLAMPSLNMGNMASFAAMTSSGVRINMPHRLAVPEGGLGSVQARTRSHNPAPTSTPHS